MRSEPLSGETEYSVDTLRARNGAVAWRGSKVRFLGVCWTGERTLYRVDGRRLSRIPAPLSKSSLLGGKPLLGEEAGPSLSLFWQMTGNSLNDFATDRTLEATSVAGASCLPSGTETESVGRVKLLHHCCAPPPQTEDSLEVHMLLWGEEDREAGRSLRVEAPPSHLRGYFSVAMPQWGAAFIFRPRPSQRKGASEISIAFSSRIAEYGCSVYGLDTAGREVRSKRLLGGGASCPEGHLRGETHEVKISPGKLSGLLIYPRHCVLIDWGRVKLPPRPKGKESP